MIDKCNWCRGLGFAVSETSRGTNEVQKCDMCDILATDDEAADVVRWILSWYEDCDE